MVLRVLSHQFVVFVLQVLVVRLRVSFVVDASLSLRGVVRGVRVVTRRRDQTLVEVPIHNTSRAHHTVALPRVGAISSTYLFLGWMVT